MLGSIFIGLSGMRAFSDGLRQLSNNITNINSTGFKATNLSFVNLFGQRSADQGQGVALGEARIDFAQGELRQTGRDLDLAVDGGGFLVLLGDNEHVFTRTGSFEINDDGDVVLAGTELKLAALDEAGRPAAISVSGNRTNPAKATTTIKFADNLSSTASTFTLNNVSVFNAEGVADKWSIKFERPSQSSEWTLIVTNGANTEIGRQTLRFIGSVVDPSTSRLSVTEGGRTVTLDFSRNVSSLSSGDTSTLRVASTDGFAAGEITSLQINDDGKAEILYSNGEKKALGAIALASFRDLDALRQENAGIFTYHGEDGPDFVDSESALVGRVVSGRIEASNVDLSREFGELILVQRGYQASSQVVSVSNDMIQQLFGIRGQG